MKKTTTKKKLAGLSQSEFARAEKISRQAVQARIAAGMPILANGRVELKAAREWCAANLKSHAGGESFAAARARKESTLADLRALELARTRTAMLDLGEVLDAVVDRNASDLLAFLEWPKRVYRVMAAELHVDPESLLQVLEKHVVEFVRERLRARSAQLAIQEQSR